MIKRISLYIYISIFCFCFFPGEKCFADIDSSPVTPSTSQRVPINTDFISLSPPEPDTLEWETYWRELRDKLISKTISLTTWEKQVSDYFEMESYNPRHTQLWDLILRQTPESQEDLLMYATIFTAVGLLSEVHKQSPNAMTIATSSQFLLKLGEYLKNPQMTQIADIIYNRGKKSPINLTTLWNAFVEQVNNTEGALSPQISASMHETIVYLCLALLAYLPNEKFSAVVQLPGPMKSFFNEQGILIFDGGIFTESHYRSLKSIFQCLPPRLHNIQVIIVPEGVGVSATKIIASPNNGVVTDMPFLPMEIMSNPLEFPPPIGPQVAPEFSMQAVVQIVRTMQWTQFRLRPELLYRRNTIFMNARARNYSWTRSTVPPEIFLNNPDELLPLSSYLWFLNSEKALQMANDLLKLRQHFTTDVYLLLADMLSEGRDVTLTFFMDESGSLTVREAPVIRAPIDEGFPAVISILPERLLPTFNLENKPDKSTIFGESLNQPIKQNSPFQSNFETPNDNDKEKGLSPKNQIIIQPKGN